MFHTMDGPLPIKPVVLEHRNFRQLFARKRSAQGRAGKIPFCPFVINQRSGDEFGLRKNSRS